MTDRILPASVGNTLRALAWDAWRQPDPQRKCDAARELARLAGIQPARSAGAAPGNDLAPTELLSHALLHERAGLVDEFEAVRADPPLRPGRPARPERVHPRDVPDRGVGTELGRAALLHAIAHIEFNAIDLALDAVWRFAQMPEAWLTDWIDVAADEARHFCMLQTELLRRGFTYGDFPAHDGLWEMALRTRNDVLLRVALVPRLLEARGLDATPRIMSRLGSAKDARGVAILEVILREEVRHVEIGNAWYHRLCLERGLDPLTVWDDLARSERVALPVPPFNREARLRAGFTEMELRRWESRPPL
jgi:uncharacterized ferritin-like protein (DUF455 family)